MQVTVTVSTCVYTYVHACSCVIRANHTRSSHERCHTFSLAAAAASLACFSSSLFSSLVCLAACCVARTRRTLRTRWVVVFACTASCLVAAAAVSHGYGAHPTLWWSGIHPKVRLQAAHAETFAAERPVFPGANKERLLLDTHKHNQVNRCASHDQLQQLQQRCEISMQKTKHGTVNISI